MNNALRAALATYRDELRSQHATGHAKEHAYRPALKTLMEAFDNIIAINDPCSGVDTADHHRPDHAERPSRPVMSWEKTSDSTILVG